MAGKDLRCIFVLVCLHVGCAEVAGATAHKAFPGSVIGLSGSHDPAAWKRNDPDKSAYQPMGGSFRVGDLTPDTPNAEVAPDDIEDKPERPGGFYEKEIAIEKGKAARHESLQGPFDDGTGTKRQRHDLLDETFLECDAHPERCKDEDLEEEAKQKAELETVTVDNVILDKDSDNDYDDDAEPSKTKLVEFPWIKSHDDFFKHEPVKAAKEMAAENSRARTAFDKKFQDAGNPDVKIPVSIDYDRLKAEKSKNYDIDCDGPHGDPKNCQKYDGEDIDIESAEQAEHHHRVLAWHLATLANRNKYDDSYVEGLPNHRFDGYKNFDADMPNRYDDIDSLNEKGALQRAEEIRQEDSTSGLDIIDTEEGTELRKKDAARLAKVHKKKLPKPTQAEKFAIAEKIKLAEAQDEKDTTEKHTEWKQTVHNKLMHDKKLAENRRQNKGQQGESWSATLKASLPWSKTSNDQLAKKTKKSKTNTENLRR